jgi:hypothetical protein
MRTFIKLWLWYEKKTHLYILMFYPFESTKNPSTIVLSSYFHIFETWVWHLLSCTCISKNVPKCILIHAIIQYYAMKSKIFLLLIIKVKYIHDFNVLNLSYGYFPPKKEVTFMDILYHAFTHLKLQCFLKRIKYSVFGPIWACICPFHP